MIKSVFLVALLALALGFLGCRNGESSDGDGDSDVDGDVDGDSDADGDGDATTGCYPALGICDPIAQCGCAEGQICDVVVDTASNPIGTSEGCVGATGGTGQHGDEGCVPGTCAPGHTCANEADPDGNPIAVCRAWCIEESDCGEYPGSQCNREICYVDGDGNPVGCVEPYKLCTPEVEALGVGHAEFSACTGLADDCPGNPPFDYTINVGESGENASCNFDRRVDPATLDFALRDVEQSLSVTAYALVFDWDAAQSGFTPASANELTRFNFYLPASDSYSTELINSPPGRGSCDVQIHYIAETEGFELEFTCNHIMTAFTDSQLTTMDGDEMGPGTLSIEGCALLTD